MTIFAPFVLGVLYFLVDSMLISAVFFGLLIGEKFIDELLRFQLFSKNFIDWSKIMLSKAIVPLAAVLTGILIDWDTSILFILASYIIYFFILLVGTPHQTKKLFKLEVQNLQLSHFTGYFEIYKDKLLYNQILSFTGRNVLAVDKWYVKTFGFTTLLDQITLISQLSNMINVFVDFFFISTRRSLYVEEATPLKKLSEGLRLYLLGIVAFIAYAVLMHVFFIYTSFAQISEISALGLGVCFLLFAYSAPYSQFCFWNESRKKGISIDLVFFLVSGLCIFLLPIADFIPRLISSLIIAQSIRFTLLFSLSKLISVKYQRKATLDV